VDSTHPFVVAFTLADVFVSPIYTLFLPLRVPPYTDGHSWARRQGLERHHGIQVGEEFTDEEDI
jgi:hypothetical protein